ncbi:hypothetical protein Hanom_Chr12g01113421 [Helianthus anomalus]
MVETRRKVLISEKSVIYRSNIGPISVNIADIIGTDILTDILHRYLGRGPITIPVIYWDINYIGTMCLISEFYIDYLYLLHRVPVHIKVQG